MEEWWLRRDGDEVEDVRLTLRERPKLRMGILTPEEKEGAGRREGFAGT